MSKRYQDVLYEKQNHIATITLNRPENRNALTQTMISAIAQFAGEAEEDDDVRVVVLAANGEHFSVGLDRSYASEEESGDIKRITRTRFPEAAWKNWTLGHLFQMAKPSIAAVGGTAAGGGLTFALECDIRIASDRAKFSTAFSRTGLPVIDAQGVLLPAAIGLSRAMELIYTSRLIDAAEAEKIGLVSRVVRHEQLMETAIELATEIAAGPPIANRLSKHMVQTPLRLVYDAHLPYQLYAIHINKSLGEHDLQEGFKAFFEKRLPHYKGLSGRRRRKNKLI